MSPVSTAEKHNVPDLIGSILRNRYVYYFVIHMHLPLAVDTKTYVSPVNN
jgi:hypothetical protein